MTQVANQEVSFTVTIPESQAVRLRAEIATLWVKSNRDCKHLFKELFVLDATLKEGLNLPDPPEAA